MKEPDVFEYLTEKLFALPACAVENGPRHCFIPTHNLSQALVLFCKCQSGEIQNLNPDEIETLSNLKMRRWIPEALPVGPRRWESSGRGSMTVTEAKL